MLAVTFLGHQGWMLQSKQVCLLVDPLLREDFGDAQALEYRLFPPRVWTPDLMPAIDAVILTHEHDDHFDIASLAALERAIPIYLSSRSSTAAKAILQTMGFTVHALRPGIAQKFGDLEFTPFAGDHVASDCGDEWDTLPFFVRHVAGSGNFFSMVDIPITERHVKWAATKAARPILIGWTNNALDWSHMADYMDPREEATENCFLKMGYGHKLITSTWGTPDAMAMCAGGFSFRDERAWLNEHIFCVDNAVVCEKMKKLYRNEHFTPTRPGQTFRMEGNRVKAISEDAPFLTTAPKESWPARGHNPDGEVKDYAPATGRRAFSSEDERALEASLQDFAAAIFGGAIFKGLASLLDSETDERKPTFAITLRRQGSDNLQFEYQPSACAFVRSDENVKDTTVAGIETWASDFLAVLRGELGPIALTFGRARLWNALPTRLRFDIFGDLYRISHPLRRPAEMLRVYQRLWNESKEIAPRIKAASA